VSRLLSRRGVVRLLAVTLAAASLSTVAFAQDDARLEIVLPARAVGRAEGPAFIARSVLASRELRELLTSGFPARLHFRCELWRNERLNNRINAAVEWDVVVRFDQLARVFEVYRIVGDRATLLSRGTTLDDAQAALEQPFRILAPPMQRGRSYYYDASLDVEVLTQTDLNEVERWLKGDVRPAIRGERNAGTAVTQTIRSVFLRLLGGERRHYETRSRVFTAEQ
jgi:hypothetical protein